MDNPSFLNFPDPLDTAKVDIWIKNAQAAIGSKLQSNVPLLSADFTSTKNLSDFTKGLYLADRLCYPHPADQADYPRLATVVSSFPLGFHLYFTMCDDTHIPVAYTGWYPIGTDIFDMMHDTPERITHRGMMKPQPNGEYIYLFNYSIIPAFQKTAQSKSMLQDYAKAISNIPHMGMSAVTVSTAGMNVARRFGLSQTGMMTHECEPEAVFCLKNS